MLGSAVQRHESAIYIHIAPPSWASLSPPYPTPLHPTPLNHHRTQSWTPCAIQPLPTSYFTHGSVYMLGFLSGSAVKNLPAMQETWVQSLGWEDPLEREIATHSNLLAWRIPWTVHGGYSPGGLQSIESQALDMTEATEHAHTSVCMSILISQFVPLSPPTPLSTCPFSMSVSLFLSCK